MRFDDEEGRFDIWPEDAFPNWGLGAPACLPHVPHTNAWHGINHLPSNSYSMLYPSSAIPWHDYHVARCKIRDSTTYKHTWTKGLGYTLLHTASSARLWWRPDKLDSKDSLLPTYPIRALGPPGNRVEATMEIRHHPSIDIMLYPRHSPSLILPIRPSMITTSATLTFTRPASDPTEVQSRLESWPKVF